MRRLSVLLLLALAACGSRQELRPAPGEALPVQPEQSSRPQAVADLLAVPPTARPDRVDEVLTRSEEREADRFDLPPPQR